MPECFFSQKASESVRQSFRHIWERVLIRTKPIYMSLTWILGDLHCWTCAFDPPCNDISRLVIEGTQYGRRKDVGSVQIFWARVAEGLKSMGNRERYWGLQEVIMKGIGGFNDPFSEPDRILVFIFLTEKELLCPTPSHEIEQTEHKDQDLPCQKFSEDDQIRKQFCNNEEKRRNAYYLAQKNVDTVFVNLSPM